MRTDREAAIITKLIDLLADDTDFEKTDSGIYFEEEDLAWNYFTWGDVTWGEESVILHEDEEKEIIKMIEKRHGKE
jgi:hypothetical protein